MPVATKVLWTGAAIVAMEEGTNELFTIIRNHTGDDGNRKNFRMLDDIEIDVPGANNGLQRLLEKAKTSDHYAKSLRCAEICVELEGILTPGGVLGLIAAYFEDLSVKNERDGDAYSDRLNSKVANIIGELSLSYNVTDTITSVLFRAAKREG